MTITLTVEEIEAFQGKLWKWFAQRGDAIARHLRERHDPMGLRTMDQEELRAFMEKWDKEHPMPNLLPKI